MSQQLGLVPCVSLALAVGLLFGIPTLRVGDFFMWAMIGRYTREHGWPPTVDEFSFTTPGVEFVAHSWLSGVIFSLIEPHVGWAGFRLLRLSLVSTALFFACRTAKLLGASWSALVLIAPFVLGILWARLEVRPYLFTSALLACELWLLVSVHLGQRDWRWLLTLVPLYALWINLHGGWVQGMLMLVVVGLALVATEARRRWLGREATSHLSLRHLALVLVACGCALLVNPYGPRLLWFPFEMSADWIRAAGPEWQTPWLSNQTWWLVGGAKGLPAAAAFWLYMTVLAGALCVALRRWRSGDLVPLALAAFWLVMGLRHLRSVSDTVLLTSPFLAAALPAWRTGVVVGTVGLLGLAGVSVPSTLHTWDTSWSIDPLPCVRAMVERTGLGGRVFSIDMQQWLVYRFHPKITVHQTWEYVAGEQGWRDIRTARRTLPVFLDRHQVDVVILSQSVHVNAKAYIPVLLDHGWILIHQDGQSLVFVADRPHLREVIAREGYRWVPGRYATTPEEALDVLDESNRAINNCPDDPYAAFLWERKAHALELLGFRAEAEAAARHGEALHARGGRRP
jgi:hypothetical protein